MFRKSLALDSNYLSVKLVERMTCQCGSLPYAFSMYKKASGMHFYLKPSLWGLLQGPKSKLLGQEDSINVYAQDASCDLHLLPEFCPHANQACEPSFRLNFYPPLYGLIARQTVICWTLTSTRENVMDTVLVLTELASIGDNR